MIVGMKSFHKVVLGRLLVTAAVPFLWEIVKMTRKDIQFIAICVGAAALVVIAAHLVWPPEAQTVHFDYIQAPQGDVYVASVNSEVFHKPDCRWANLYKIKPYNLTGFKSREDAVESGRRPCKVCKP